MKFIVLSDTHLNRPYGYNGHGKGFTKFGEREKGAFESKLQEVDGAIIVGDFVDAEVGLDKRKKNDPRKYLEYLQKVYPDKTFRYLVGNHDGETDGRYTVTPDDNARFRYGKPGNSKHSLSGYEAANPLFSVSDILTIQNALFIHGHRQIYLGGNHYDPQYFVGEDQKPKTGYKTEDAAGICSGLVENSSVISEFIHSFPFLKEGQNRELWIFLGHTHKKFTYDLTITRSYADDIMDGGETTLKFRNLGCTLPGRAAAFKIVDFKEDGSIVTEDFKLPRQR